MLSGASNTIGELKMNGGNFGVSQLAREEATAKVGKLTGTRGAINLLHATLTLTGTDTVSYTHLDVYKRQASSQITPRFIMVCTTPGPPLEATSQPVSYTHLPPAW